MAVCSIPLRPVALSCLLTERCRQDALHAYEADIQWSILCSLHAMGGKRCHAPSYSDMVKRIGQATTAKPAAVIDSTKNALAKMLSAFEIKAVKK